MIYKLQLESLQLRRLKLKLKLMHKILHGSVELPGSLISRARDNIHIKPVNARVQVYQNSFIPSTINQWTNCRKKFANEQNYDIFANFIQTYNP